MPQVSQSGFLLGALLAGFVLWLMLNNRLGTYWNILIGGSSGSGSGSKTTAGTVAGNVASGITTGLGVGP